MAIISYSRSFVFVKTRKTAGSSIELDLAPLLADDDIITPLAPPEPGHRPRNYRFLFRDRFRSHMPATAIRRRIGRRRWDAMFSFCVEREPVAKCISHFHFRRSRFAAKPGVGDQSWADYVSAGDFPVDVEKYTERHRGRRALIVDQVLPYEALGVELARVLCRVGIPDFRLQARSKAQFSERRLVREEDVTPDQVRTIYGAFAESCTVTGLYLDRLAAAT